MRAKLVIVLFAVLAAWQFWTHRSGQAEAPAPVAGSASAAHVQSGFQAGARVQASGIVERVLADDTSGSRHQRFIVRLPSGQTLLIAHNIDIAPRVEGIARGDTVSFSGIYEPNDKGGIVHWTHHDPSGHHAAGWIEHRGHRYQ
jgi:hypothetical protein